MSRQSKSFNKPKPTKRQQRIRILEYKTEMGSKRAIKQRERKKK